MEKFRGFPQGWQLALHLQDSENGVYRRKNGNETFTAEELDTAAREGVLKDISIKRPV
ncbi:MAG: hypothetical protein Q7R71_00610 [bacterium]|nr:hypothetical protein [bacterium]